MIGKACDKYSDGLMELAEGVLAEPAKAELQAHVESCPGCRAELEWLTAAGRDLEAIGDSIVQGAPQVSLVGPVMAAIAVPAASAKPHVVTFKPVTRRRVLLAWAGLATVAAVAVFVLYIAGYRVMRAPGDSAISIQSKAPGGQGQPGSSLQALSSDTRERLAQNKTGLEKAKHLLPPDLARIPGPRLPKEAAAETTRLKLEDVLAARRDAVTNGDEAGRISELSKIAQWASLSPEKARELINADGKVTEAEIGAALSLSPEEAQPILLAAVKASPDDAYLRYALADSYGDQPENAAKANAELVAASNLDPDNALAQYKLAANLFDQGDVEGASAALSQAQSLAGASAYAAQAAGYHEEALVASGVEPNVAHLLTALTAGTSQYSDITGLSNQLIEFGKYYEQQGNTDLAQKIYESVREFGSQVADSAAFSSEELAGLDSEQAAIEILSQFTDFIQSPDNLNLLTEQARQLSQAFDVFRNFMQSLNQFFVNTVDPHLIQLATDVILQNGDLNLFDNLYGTSGQHGH